MAQKKITTNLLEPVEVLKNILKSFLKYTLFSGKQNLAVEKSKSTDKPEKDRWPMNAEQRLSKSYLDISSGMNRDILFTNSGMNSL